jgi:histidinol-phosphate aminotransferase
VLVVLDEAYFEYVRANDYPNGLHYLNRRERLVVLRTFSKCYGLAGVRVGYGVADPKLIDYLNRGRLPFNVNLLGQVGALAALDDDEHLERTVKTNAAEMQRVVLGLRQHGLRVTDSQANFILVDFLRSSDDVFKDLLLQGVIVRPMGGYGFKNCVRITIGSPEQNERLLASVDRILT